MSDTSNSSSASEFGGYSGRGIFQNVDGPGGILAPHLERTSLMQTDDANDAAIPAYGTGGVRVQ